MRVNIRYVYKVLILKSRNFDLLTISKGGKKKNEEEEKIGWILALDSSNREE